MNRYKVLDETKRAIRIFHKKSEAVRFLQDGWSIIFIKSESKYQQALNKVGEALL